MTNLNDSMAASMEIEDEDDLDEVVAVEPDEEDDDEVVDETDKDRID